MSDKDDETTPAKQQKDVGERTYEETPPEDMDLEHKARSQRNRRWISTRPVTPTW